MVDNGYIKGLPPDYLYWCFIVEITVSVGIVGLTPQTLQKSTQLLSEFSSTFFSAENTSSGKYHEVLFNDLFADAFNSAILPCVFCFL
jgi:hypothetical protein